MLFSLCCVCFKLLEDVYGLAASDQSSYLMNCKGKRAFCSELKQTSVEVKIDKESGLFDGFASANG